MQLRNDKGKDGQTEKSRFIMNDHYDQIIKLIESRAPNANVTLAAASPVRTNRAETWLPSWAGIGFNSAWSSGGPVVLTVNSTGASLKELAPS